MTNQLVAVAALIALPHTVSPQVFQNNKSNDPAVCYQSAQWNPVDEVADLTGLAGSPPREAGFLHADDFSPHGREIRKSPAQIIYVLAPNPKKKPLDAFTKKQNYLLLSL